MEDNHDYMKEEYHKCRIINKLLNDRCDNLLSLISEIRYYLIECKEDHRKIDIDMIIKKLD